MNVNKLLRRAKARSFRRPAVRPRTALLLASLEDRTLLASNPGSTLSGATPRSADGGPAQRFEAQRRSWVGLPYSIRRRKPVPQLRKTSQKKS